MSQATLLFAARAHLGDRSRQRSNSFKGMGDSDWWLTWVGKMLSVCICFNFVPQKTNQYVYPPVSGARVYTGDSVLTSDPETFIYMYVYIYMNIYL